MLDNPSANFHAQVGYANAREGIDRTIGGQAASVPTMFEIFQLEPSISPAHSGAHRRKTLQVFLLRQEVQATVARATAH